MIGNIAGDLVKRPVATHALHPRVADGVRRHRRVDALTDSNSDLALLKPYFPADLRRYSGIVLDVLFDYYLCRHWSSFCVFDRGNFVEGIYRVLSDDTELLPQPLAKLAPHWVQADWLAVYESLEGVAAVLDRVSQRLQAARVRRGLAVTRLAPNLSIGVSLAERYDREFEAGFLAVFTSVQRSLDRLGDTQPARLPGLKSAGVTL
jgi:acyl carrier protein phosphodiesterase